jgi:hypothetical protein
MTAYLDTKFINLVSPRLDRFAWKKPNLAVCRCPVCGDSTKNKAKTRFYFYEKGGNYFVRCHNCDYSTTLGVFIRFMDETLYRQYCLEAFADKRQFEGRPEPKPVVETPPKPRNEALATIPRLLDLPEYHPAVRWADTRKIPDHKRHLLYYSKNFFEFVNQIDPDAKVGDDERIVIPCFDLQGNLIGIQGRFLRSGNQTPARFRLSGEKEIRYITIKTNPNGDRLWYGLERVKKDEPIIVTEGPLDSLFLRNSVAMLGLSDPLYVPEGLPTNRLIYALDNEPRNENVVEAMKKLIDGGRSVCIWDRNVKSMKDINDMVMRKIRPIEIESMIRTCTYNGLNALLALNRWKRV